MSAPSPTPSNMPPPPTLKRPRQSAGTSTPVGGQSSTLGTTSGGNPRVKRRKNEVDDAGGGADSSEGGPRGKGGSNSYGPGANKSKDDDGTDVGEISTRIDFKTLPVETLYKYLEHHDLLPRWEVSPWSEDPCVPPTALYSAAPPPPAPAPTFDESSVRSPSLIPQKPEGEVVPTSQSLQDHALLQQPQTASGPDAVLASNDTTDPAAAVHGERPVGAPAEVLANGDRDGEAGTNGAGGDSAELEEMDTPAPPTTRSKTAPRRKQPTLDTSPGPLGDQPRPVITLSDVHAARDILAERANAHWVKGLGGGQNKEGETIVNFLYKMKVGPGRLLRVYNPPPPAFGAL